MVYDDSAQNGVYVTTDAGLSGATVTLTGTDSNGQAVSMTTTSDPNGAYSFTGLLPGTYTITYTPVASFATEAAADAPAGTTATPGAVSNIVVTTTNVVVNLPEVINNSTPS